MHSINSLGGQVQMIFGSAPSTVPLVKANRLRALAVTTMKRMSSFPELPTIDEAGVKGFDLASWTGLFAPAGTPAPVVERLNREINAVLAMPEVTARFTALGIEATPKTAADFSAFSAVEVGKWTDLVKAAGIEPAD